MFEMTNQFLTFLLNNRLKVTFLVAFVIIVGFISTPTRSQRNLTTLRESGSTPLVTGITPPCPYIDNGTVPAFCRPTYQIEKIHKERNKSYVNPAQHVLEELLQMVTFGADLCSNIKKDGKRLAVTIVDTARTNFKERQLIRQTWGSIKMYKEWRIRTVFLLGQSDHCLNDFEERKDNKNIDIIWKKKEYEISLEEKSLVMEHQLHGDLVIGSFVDTYRNLTYKHLMGYKFVQEICPDAEFIIKTDDDMFVDIPAILDMRGSEFTRNSTSEKMYDIYCHQYHDSPTRDPKGKWFSTLEEWAEETYPVYCLGNDYAISMEWLKKIYSVRGLGGFFWVDDVFIMGKLRTIAEENYNETTNRLNMWARGHTTDQRGSPNFVKENCDKEDGLHIGWFVFLKRSNKEFFSDMQCLWSRALRNANATDILSIKLS